MPPNRDQKSQCVLFAGTFNRPRKAERLCHLFRVPITVCRRFLSGIPRCSPIYQSMFYLHTRISKQLSVVILRPMIQVYLNAPVEFNRPQLYPTGNVFFFLGLALTQIIQEVLWRVLQIRLHI